MVIMHAQSYTRDTTWRALLKDLGISPASALRRAGLAEDLLQQPSVRLASEEYYRLWDGIEAELGDALLPLRLCEAIRSESFSPPLFAALCSPNLLCAARRVAQYKRLIGPMRIDVTEERNAVSFQLTWLDAPLTPPLSLVMTELLFSVAIARMATREPVWPIEVTTTVLPSPIAAYEQFLGARIRRGSKLRVSFTTADALQPFLTSDDSLWRMFESTLRNRLADLDSSAPTSERVSAVLSDGI